MEFDPSQIAAHVGTAAATFAAAWAAIMRGVKQRTATPEDLNAARQDVDKLSHRLSEAHEKIARLEEGREHAKTAHLELSRRLERFEDQLRKTVTDEEFQAHTRQTTQSVNGLTERVSKITGFLDAQG